MPLRRHGTQRMMVTEGLKRRLVFDGRIGKNVIHVFPLGPFRPLVRQPSSLPSSPPVLLSVAKKPTARSATIQARVTPDELASLTAIATAHGVTTREIVRRLVRSVAGVPVTAGPEEGAGV